MSLAFSSSPRPPVWWRLACEMRAEGWSIERIAEEFGEDVEDVFIIVADVDPARNAERMRKLHADPEFAARNAERMRKLHADPEFAARNAERMRKLHADPEFAARNAERMRKLHADPEFAARNAERMRKLHADPEFAARIGRRPSWCPAEKLAEYRELSAKYGRSRAKEIILAHLPEVQP